MDISEVSRSTGVPASTLRFYEKKGLITSLGQQHGSRRKFARSVLDHLALISLGQAAGLSLDEIRSMMLPAGEPNIDRRLLAAKADEIDSRIERLTAVSYGLRHAAACPAASHAECPTFAKLLKAAASGALERRWGNSAPKHPRRRKIDRTEQRG
jgi:DNA-binding transcriptional MerR regulator